MSLIIWLTQLSSYWVIQNLSSELPTMFVSLSSWEIQFFFQVSVQRVKKPPNMEQILYSMDLSPG